MLTLHERVALIVKSPLIDPQVTEDPVDVHRSAPSRLAWIGPALAGSTVVLLIALLAAFFWPGMAMYDTVAQYGQVVSGDIDDWHPPAMVRLWQLMATFASGTAPMFALQVALYSFGFGLLVAAFVRSRRRIAALAAAVLALSPLLLGWQMVVLKDGQMLGALLAAFAIVAHFRLAGKNVPPLAGIFVFLLIGYATLVRANALFATVPLGIFLSPRPQGLVLKSTIGIAAIVLLLAISPAINHRLLGASPSGVAKSQPLFDLSAIAVATPGSVPPITASERASILRRHCVKPFFWDPIADPSACGDVTARINALPEEELYFDLARAVAKHPLAYADHRLKHWNSTERWLVQPGLIDAEPPDEAEPNDLGLKTPRSGIVPLWQGLAAFEAQTPFGWPIAWTCLALLLFPVAWRHRLETAGGLALALLVSALALEGSFLAISIASDLRYHLWSILAAALALILLSQELRGHRRALVLGGTALALVSAGGVIARSSLSHAPSSYQEMLHSPAG